MKGKTGNVIRIPTSLNTTFFKYWMDFLKPIHNLTNKELETAAIFLKCRYDLSKVISDEDLLDKNVMSDDTKQKIIEELCVSSVYFQNLLSRLKQSKFIVDGKINKRFIPHVTKDAKEFNLMLHFELK